MSQCTIDVLLNSLIASPLLNHLKIVVYAGQLVSRHGLDWALLWVAAFGRTLGALTFDLLVEQADQLLLLHDYILDQHGFKRLRDTVIFVAPVEFILAGVDIFARSTLDLTVCLHHASTVWTILVSTRNRLRLSTWGLLGLSFILSWAFIDSQELGLLLTIHIIRVSMITIILSCDPNCIDFDRLQWLLLKRQWLLLLLALLALVGDGLLLLLYLLELLLHLVFRIHVISQHAWGFLLHLLRLLWVDLLLGKRRGRSTI